MLNMGVLLLGVPPFLILAGYCYLFYRKNQVTRTADACVPARRRGVSGSQTRPVAVRIHDVLVRSRITRRVRKRGAAVGVRPAAGGVISIS